MKEALSKLGAFLTGAATTVTLTSFAQNLANDKKYQEVLQQLEKNSKMQADMSTKEYLIGKAESKIKEVEIQSYKNDFQSQINSLTSHRERLENRYKEYGNINNPSDYDSKTLMSDVKYRVDCMWREMTNLNNRTSELLDRLDNPSETSLDKGQENTLDNIDKIQDDNSIDQINNFMSNFPSLSDLGKLLENWNSFLNTLTLQELGAVAHFISSLFVLICLINIIMVIYGDFMIRLLKLETRFPKIAKIIQLRRQFQLYYMLIYFIPAILTLLAVMAINAYALFG